MSLLETINTPSDLKKLSVKQLPELCQDIRAKIISVSNENGGHLASSLGAVESIVALYYVFDFPKDKINVLIIVFLHKTILYLHY